MGNGLLERERSRARIPRLMTLAFSNKDRISASATKPTLQAILSWVSTSPSEPIAIRKKRMYSFVAPRLFPSAILDGTETAARRNWDVSP